jgi:ABC-2 type transport system ATP-binding protein
VSPPVVEARGLTKSFRAREKAPGLAAGLRGLVAPHYRDVAAVAGIDLYIEAGEVVAFIGPNGAGKSTTIKMLTGILYPSAGSAHVLGLVPWDERQKLSYRISTVFGQRSQLWYHLPPADSLELLAHIYELDQTTYRARLHDLVERFEIASLLDVPVRKLSLGERMRCEIVGSLLHRPSILFLDEPTIGLDVVAKQRIRQHIRELNETEGTTVFLTSHDAGDVEQLCRRVIMINHGTVVFDDSVTALKQQFLARKRIELKLVAPAAVDFSDTPGIDVVRHDEFELVVEVDTAAQPIEAVIARLMASARVADVSIQDRPLEEIIASMYQSDASSFGADRCPHPNPLPKGEGT